MKKQLAVASITFVCVVVVAAYIRHRNSATTSSGPAELTSQASSPNSLPASGNVPALQDSSVRQQQPPPPPPPPPFPGTPPVKESPPEPPRTLLGLTTEDLRQIEEYLPAGARVYTYPVGKSYLAAAVITADLNGRGKDETVVVSAMEQPSSSLDLNVLVWEKNTLRLVASTRMVGGVLFDLKLDGTTTHLAARDMVGDSRPEIIVVPATGASAGGALEVYSFEDSALRKIAHIGGHLFKVRSKIGNKPSAITASRNGEEETRVFEWDGRNFIQTKEYRK